MSELDRPDLHSYLLCEEGLHYHQLAVNSWKHDPNYSNDRIELRVDIPKKSLLSSKRKLAINMTGRCRANKHDVPLEQLLDFNAINRFILTGEIPPKETKQ